MTKIVPENQKNQKLSDPRVSSPTIDFLGELMFPNKEMGISRKGELAEN